MEGLRAKFQNKRTRHMAYAVLIGVMVLWVIYRFAAIAAEGRLAVFNPVRSAAEIGAPVETMIVQNKSGILREPILIQNNRGYVSYARVGKFAAGQKIGDGKITSVSSQIDLDTGMYIVRTRGASNGTQYAEYVAKGIFVPVYAVTNNTVMVARDGVANAVQVTVARQDADNALITSGLKDGDVVILSNIDDAAPVKILQ